MYSTIKKIALLFFIAISYTQMTIAQDNHYVRFDIIYLKEDSVISKPQVEKLKNRIEYINKYDINSIFINTAFNKSSEIVNQKRIQWLKTYLISQAKITPELIQMLNSPEQHSDFIHELSDEMDVLELAVSYSNKTDFPGIKTQPNGSLEKDILLDRGVKSTVTKSAEVCIKDTVLQLSDQISISINGCDYRHVENSIKLDTYLPQDLLYYPWLTKESAPLSKTMAIYDLSFLDRHELCYPAELKISVDPCIPKYELSVFLLSDAKNFKWTAVTTENLFYAEKDDFIKVKLSGSEVYKLVFEPKRPAQKISFSFPRKWQIKSFSLNTLCMDEQYSLDNTSSLQMPLPTYLPYLTVWMVNDEGKEVKLVNKALSQLTGSGSEKEIIVKDLQSGKDVPLKLHEEYNLDKDLFK